VKHYTNGDVNLVKLIRYVIEVLWNI